MEQVTFRSNLILDIDPAQFLSGQGAYEFPLYSPTARTNQIENTISIGGETTTQTISVKSQTYAIKSLRAYINIVSLPPVPPLLPEVTDDDFTFSVKSGENDMQYPGIAMDLIMKVGDLRAITGQFRLQNKRPGYYINLLKFVTNEPYFNGGLSTSLIVRFRDIGDGLPRMDDHIYFYGDVEESGYFGNVQPFQTENVITLNGSINAALTGSLDTSNGGGNGATITPTLSASIVFSDFPGEFLLYYLPTYDTSEIADFSNAYSWLFNPTSGEVLDLTQYLTSMGSGFYFLAATNYQVPECFWTALSLTSNTIEPSDRASVVIGQGLDPARSHTTAVTLYAVHVTNSQVSITLQFSL